MLKEIETEETVFFVTFLSLLVFQLGGQVPWAPLGYAYGRLCSQKSFFSSMNETEQSVVCSKGYYCNSSNGSAALNVAKAFY